MNKITILLVLILLLRSDKTFPQAFQNRPVYTSMHYIKDSLAGGQRNLNDKPLTEIEMLTDSRIPARTILGYSAQQRPVEAWFFPGTSNERALVVGGMHGSELSSVEVAGKLIDLLSSGRKPFFNVMIIPVLFPDNAAAGMAEKAGDINKGRYTTRLHADPNRQMPPLGKTFSIHDAHDHAGRLIERENQMLLNLIQEFVPSRIISLHAIRDVKKGGIYADPRTDCKGVALGFEEDSMLAVSMAKYIHDEGGRVPGNRMESQITALYYKDPPAVPKGAIQKRTLAGSSLPDNRGFGVSLGGWASTAVCDGEKTRDAIILITAEFPGYKPSGLYTGKAKDDCIRNVSLFAESIKNIFLEPDANKID